MKKTRCPACNKLNDNHNEGPDGFPMCPGFDDMRWLRDIAAVIALKAPLEEDDDLRRAAQAFARELREVAGDGPAVDVRRACQTVLRAGGGRRLAREIAQGMVDRGLALEVVRAVETFERACRVAGMSS